MAQIFCPACQQLLEHDRGFLPTHMTDLVRGQLVTGSKVCELSNTKIVTECKSVTYAHECEHCGLSTEMKVTEDYPGAFETIKAFIEMDCIGCTIPHDGHYCDNQGCGLEVKWKDDHWLLSYPDSKEVGEFETEAKAEQAKLDWMVANPMPAGPPVANVPAQVLNLNQIGQILNRMGDEPVIESQPAGWYDLKGGTHCTSDDPFATEEHNGVFKPEFHRTVLVTDGHIIEEEPDEEREAVNG
jgi:hypothetical protein